MSSRVLLRSSRHPTSGTVSALPTQPRQILKSSVSQNLVHRLLHSPGSGATSPSVQFQNSFLFASSGKQARSARRAFSSTAAATGKRDSKRKDDDAGAEGDGKGLHEEKESREVKERDETPDSKYSTSKEKESGQKLRSDSKKRKGNDENPVRQHRGPSVTVKGKLLSTPSRLLKLLLPLSGPLTNDPNPPNEPLALLVHPHQPLSYLGQLIQAELPPLTFSGITRPPSIAFKAIDLGDALLSADRATKVHDLKLSRRGSDNLGIVRWSTSTEIGDFVRDAARAEEFIIEIEGSPDVPVSVPSFKERTYFLRQRLKETTGEIEKIQELKRECDRVAKKAAKRVAVGGFLGLVSWWAGVYWLTFRTNYGWDVMEPVTYLVGLTTVMGSYLFFLYNHREVSYRSVLNMTVSKRQMKLYQRRGFDIDRWEELVEGGKALRREISTIAEEYDEIWDESRDQAGGERVRSVLKDDKEKKKEKNKEEEKEMDRVKEEEEEEEEEEKQK